MARMSLVEFARYAAECAMKMGEEEELPGMLLIMEVDGDAHHALIPGAQAADLGDALPLALQAMVAQHDATYAALAMEAWHSGDLDKTHPDLAGKVRAGLMRLADLPPELRGECISVLAEDRANGRAFITYRIGPKGPDGHRTFTEHTAEMAGGEMRSRFLPLFQIRRVCEDLGCDEAAARKARQALAPLLLAQLGVGTVEVSAV